MSKRLSARIVKAPELHEWQQLGRIVAIKLLQPTCQVMILAVYGFPRLHSRLADNDVMHAHIVEWAAGQTTACLIAGDLNVTASCSSLLAVPDLYGLRRVSPEVGSLITTLCVPNGVVLALPTLVGGGTSHSPLPNGASRGV